jgi:DNA repair protein RadC
MSFIYEIVKLKQEIQIHEELAPMNVKSSYGLALWLQDEIGSDSQENLVVICLDTKFNVTCYSLVHKGTINQSVVHSRDIFQRAILSNAKQIILGHNHPSNDPKPSDNDTRFTNNIVESGKLLGIPIVDHLIVGTDTYYSYQEHGLIN